jgi:RNA polymerase sigma-70 factor (ECF subfamily)
MTVEATDAFTEADCKQLQRRESAAIERWFQRFADPLYTFIYYRVGRDAEIAADVVQETFVHALQAIKRFNPRKGTMMTWLTYLSRNHIRKAVREARRHQSFAEDWPAIDRELLAAYQTIATEPLPDESLEREELTALVQMTMSSIPTNYRSALTLYYFDNKRTRDIATDFGISEGAAKSLLHRARLAFKTAFVSFARALEAPAAQTG